MKNLIPGHMRAITWLYALALTTIVGYTTQRKEAIFGAFLLVLGFFIGDQATHLDQMEHSAPPPTWIERMLQKYSEVSIFVGFVLVCIGAYLMTTWVSPGA